MHIYIYIYPTLTCLFQDKKETTSQHWLSAFLEEQGVKALCNNAHKIHSPSRHLCNIESIEMLLSLVSESEVFSEKVPVQSIAQIPKPNLNINLSSALTSSIYYSIE